MYKGRLSLSYQRSGKRRPHTGRTQSSAFSEPVFGVIDNTQTEGKNTLLFELKGAARLALDSD